VKFLLKMRRGGNYDQLQKTDMYAENKKPANNNYGDDYDPNGDD